jgi:hypothetical protein
MAGDRGERGGGLNKSRIVMAWLVTLPVTIAVAAGLFYDPLAPYREGSRVRRLAGSSASAISPRTSPKRSSTGISRAI